MAEPLKGIVVQTRGPYRFDASVRFLEGFTPASYDGAAGRGHLHMAFAAEPSWTPIALCARAHPDGLVADVVGDQTAEPGVVHDNLARIFSLDIDGTRFAEVGQRDPVIKQLQRTYPGLRPVCFWSPYEAACWAVLSHRQRIPQAAAMKQRIAEQHGTAHDIHGLQVHAFPAPRALLDAAPMLPVGETRRRRLRGIANAALDGKLSADHLRSLPAENALDELQELDGIGPFSAQLTLLRGAGHPDLTPTHERRLLQAIGQLYDITAPDLDDLDRISKQWRPYRTWCALLIRVWLEDAAD